MRAARNEWTALQAAMKDDDPACLEWSSIFVDTDDPDESAVAFAVNLCDGCPLLELCRNYADAARLNFGIWGGRQYPIRRNK